MGNALTDILMRLESDALLEQLALPKGSMQLVNEDVANKVLQATGHLAQTLVSGGSASNTIHGLAALGVGAGFIGKVGNDTWGDFFGSDMKKRGIEARLLTGQSGSGRAIALISPDSERTFATYLGAAVELTEDDITPDVFRGYHYFHIEGYLVQNRTLIESALKIAHDAGLMVSLDMASFNVVAENRDFLLEMTSKYVDILFANEEEARVFTAGLDDLDALNFMSEHCPIAILKKGKEGSLIKYNDIVIKVDAVHTNSIDTTGAGDLYASGFLYGMIRSCSLTKCGKIGSLTASAVIEVIGPKIGDEKWMEIKEKISNILRD